MPSTPHVLAVVGPTASGKTALAIELAERLDTEIVSADSMQIYQGMAIGTAAPTPDDQARVRHHFVGFLQPGESFSAGEFGEAARSVVARLNAQGKTAVVVGGSGLYVQALIDGLFPGPSKDESVRLRLHRDAERDGVESMYVRLSNVDPEYANLINPNDLRRIVRALEVHELTGEPISKLHREHREQTESLDAVQVALDYPRATLYERINARVERMLEGGFVEEVRALLENGHYPHLKQLRTLGYREFAVYLHGECSYDDATETMKQNTRRFAKRQLTWFRADERIQWIPAAQDAAPAEFVDPILSRLA